MKARIRPLDGKYYGTIVEIDYDGFDYSFELWNSADFKPSERSGYDEEDICDGHFESQKTYDLAMKIVGLINHHYGMMG